MTCMSTALATPIKTTVSANFNHHRAVQQGPGVLRLQPVRTCALLWTGLRLLVLAPLIYFALRHFSTERQLQLWGALLPVLGGLPLIDPDEGRYAEIPREMLEQAMPRLRDMLAGQGIQLGQTQVLKPVQVHHPARVRRQLRHQGRAFR